MKPHYLLPLVFVVLVHTTFAQQKKTPNFNKRNNEQKKFLDKQWWIGIKGGGNLTQPEISKRYAVVAPSNYDPKTNYKRYESMKQLGTQAAIEVSFYYKGFSFSVQPALSHVRFDYSNQFEWISTVEGNRFELLYDQQNKANFIDLPLIVKYEFGSGNLKPYVQAGVYSSMLVDATKNVQITRLDYAAGGLSETKDEPVIVGATDLFAKYNWGLMGGAGVYYNVGNIRVSLDIQYRKGMSLVNATETRYNNDRLSGIGDAYDDLKLNNLSFNLGCLFPLRFLQSGFKSTNR